MERVQVVLSHQVCLVSLVSSYLSQRRKGSEKQKQRMGKEHKGKEKRYSVLGAPELKQKNWRENDYTTGNRTVISQPPGSDKPDPRK